MKTEADFDISNKTEPATLVHDEKPSHVREELMPITLVANEHGFVTNDQDLPKGYYRSPYFVGTFFATFLSQQAGTSTYLMTSTLLRYINADIGPTEDNGWIPTIYILSTAVGLLLFGRWSDIFGRRWFFIGASLLGLIGSIVCATAHNIPTVIGGEVLIGLGATAGSSSSSISSPNYMSLMTFRIIILYRFGRARSHETSLFSYRRALLRMALWRYGGSHCYCVRTAHHASLAFSVLVDDCHQWSSSSLVVFVLSPADIPYETKGVSNPLDQELRLRWNLFVHRWFCPVPHWPKMGRFNIRLEFYRSHFNNGDRCRMPNHTSILGDIYTPQRTTNSNLSV
jgi:hypothetical protein